MKTPLTKQDKKFDLKFFIAGPSGSGKTHFLGTYTLGPTHFYMLDRGGEKSLYKLIEKRKSSDPPITIDMIPSRQNTYTNFWKTLQQDAKAGFFDEMAEKQGLVVLPDSITTANIMAKAEIAKLNNIDLVQMSQKKNPGDTISPTLWGQLLAWMQELVGTIQELPCATASTVHLFTETDKEGSVIRRVPSVNGQFRQLIGIDFDEIYLMENKGSKHNIYFKEHNYFEAKSRVFSAKKVSDFTMDQIAQAYLSGDTLEQVKGGATPTILKKKVN